MRTLHRPFGVAAALAATALLASSAAAHVTVSPPFVEAGVAATVVFETPNERAGRATISLLIEAPRGVELEQAPPPEGWHVRISRGSVHWAGGRIEGERTVPFPLVVTARTRPGTETFRATQEYDDGETVRWDATLTVLPAPPAEAPSQRLGRAFAAGAVGLAVIAASLLALRRVRRREGVS